MWDVPEHMMIPVTASGDGPADREEAHHLACWCGDSTCDVELRELRGVARVDADTRDEAERLVERMAVASKAVATMTPQEALEQMRGGSYVIASDALEALHAAGFEVRPKVDAETRAEAQALVDRWRQRKMAWETARHYGIALDLDHVDIARNDRATELLSRFVLGEER